MKSYFDTSFLVSLYLPDANFAAAAKAAQAVASPIELNPFGHIELVNAVSLRVFRKEISRSQRTKVMAQIQNDIASGFLSLVTHHTTVYEEAIRLARRHSVVLGTRSFDVLHVAAAILSGATRFYSFDKRQSKLARANRLTTPLAIP
jgi:predicted nucleic acid-binding protein